jgi:hypothetical protein
MAVNIDITLKLGGSEVTGLTRQINEAVKAANPKLTLSLKSNKVLAQAAKELQKLANIRINTDGIEADLTAAIGRAAESGLNRKRTLGDVQLSTKTLDTIEKQLKKATKDLDVGLKVRAAADSPGSKVSGGEKRAQTNENKKLQAAVTRLTAQREEAASVLNKLTSFESKEAAVSARFINKVNSEREKLAATLPSETGAIASAAKTARRLEAQLLQAEASLGQTSSLTPRADATPSQRGASTVGADQLAAQKKVFNELVAQLGLLRAGNEAEAKKLAEKKAGEAKSSATVKEQERADKDRLKQARRAAKATAKQVAAIQELAIAASEDVQSISPGNAFQKLAKIERTPVESGGGAEDESTRTALRQEAINKAREALQISAINLAELGDQANLERIQTSTLQEINRIKAQEAAGAGGIKDTQSAIGALVKLRIKTEGDLTAQTQFQLGQAQVIFQAQVDEAAATKEAAAAAERSRVAREKIAQEAGKEFSKFAEIQQALDNYRGEIDSAAKAIAAIRKAAKPGDTPNFSSQGRSEEATTGTNAERALSAAKEQAAAAAIAQIRSDEEARVAREAADAAFVAAQEALANQAAADLRARQQQATSQVQAAKLINDAERQVAAGEITRANAIKKLAALDEAQSSRSPQLDLSGIGVVISNTLERERTATLARLEAAEKAATETERLAALAAVNANATDALTKILARLSAGTLDAQGALNASINLRIRTGDDLAQKSRQEFAIVEDILQSKASEAAAAREAAAAAKELAAKDASAARTRQALLDEQTNSIARGNKLIDDINKGLATQAEATRRVRSLEGGINDTASKLGPDDSAGAINASNARDTVEKAKEALRLADANSAKATEELKARTSLASVIGELEKIETQIAAKAISGEKALEKLGLIRAQQAGKLGILGNNLIKAVEGEATALNQSQKDAKVVARLTSIQVALTEKTTSNQAALKSLSELRLQNEGQLSLAVEILLHETRSSVKSEVRRAATAEANAKIEAETTEQARARNKILASQNADSLASLGITKNQLAASQGVLEQTERLANSLLASQVEAQKIKPVFGEFLSNLGGKGVEAIKRGPLLFAEIFAKGLVGLKGELNGVQSALSENKRKLSGQVKTVDDLNKAYADARREAGGLGASSADSRRLSDKLGKEQAALLKTRKSIKEQSETEEKLVARLNAALGKSVLQVEGANFDLKIPDKPQSDGAARPGGGGGSANTVTFRNAGDVNAFVGKLSAEDAGKFADSMIGVSRGANTAQKGISEYNATIESSAGRQKGLNSLFSSGSARAFEFGRATGFAAKRLASWAAPANLIFLTISRLKSAVKEVVNLDKQARRLIFFKNAGKIINFDESSDATQKLKNLNKTFGETVLSLKDASAAADTFRDSSVSIGTQIAEITESAREFGLEVGTVAEAFVTVARVGQQTTSSLRGGNGAFLEATLSLIQLENGALGATEAVRGLQAIQAQFFGGIRGNIYGDLADGTQSAAIAAESLSNATAILAATSAGSTASVSELIDATTRVGAAFRNIQGLNFDQTVAILGEAFTATGATTGRLSTALRQTATLISQNAIKIQELTGEDIVINADGTIKDFSAVLDLLRKIKDASGTLAATELSLLIADRRNIGDIQSLAQNVDALEKAYVRFGDVNERVNRTVTAQLALYDQTQALAGSLAGRINTLSAAFVKVVQGDKFRAFLDGIIKTATLATKGLGFLSNILGPLTKAIVPLLALGSIKLFAGIGSFSKGLVESFRVTLDENAALKTTTTLLDSQATRVQQIGRLQKDGLISVSQTKTALSTIANIRGQERVALANINRLQQESNGITAVGAEAELVKERILEEQGREQEKIVRLKQQELGITEQVATKAAKTLAVENQRKAAAQATFAKGAALAAGASLLLSAAGKDGLSDGVNKGLVASSAIMQATGNPLLAAVGGLALAIGAEIAEGLTGGAKRGLKAAEDAAARENKKGTNRGLLNKFVDEQIKFEKSSGGDVLDDEARTKDNESKQLLQNLRNQLKLETELENLGRGTKEENEATDKRLIAARATFATLSNNRAEIRQQNKARGATRDTLLQTQNILERNRAIGERIAKGEGTAFQRAQDRDELRKNGLRLEGAAFKAALETLGVQKKINAEIFKRDKLLAEAAQRAEVGSTISGLAKELGSAGGTQAGLELKFSLDEDAFNRSIEQANERIKILTETAAVIGQVDPKAAAQIRKDIEKEEANKRKSQLALITKFRASEKAILLSAVSSTQEQIKAWESASQRVTTAFSKIVEEQKTLAGLFAEVGQLNSNLIKSAADQTFKALEAGGATIATRLAAISSGSGARINQVRSTAARRSSTVGSTFTDSAQLGVSVDNLLGSIAKSLADSDKKVAGVRLGVVNTEIAVRRNNLREERASVALRVSETRRELSIRKDAINQEISILKDRFSAQKRLIDIEKKLAEERRKQVTAFGEKLIESPEEFKKTLGDISSATNFFKGITSINVDALKTIASRVANARGSGERGDEALRAVLRGIKASEQFGRGEIAGGIDNKTLRQIFTSIEVQNLGEINRDLIKQQRGTEDLKAIQVEIRTRQEKLVRITEFDIAIQEQLLRLAQIDAKLAEAQRGQQLVKMGETVTKLGEMRETFQGGINLLLGVLTGDKTPDELKTLGDKLPARIASIVRQFAPKKATGKAEKLRAANTKAANVAFVSGIKTQLAKFAAPSQADKKNETEIKKTLDLAKKRSEQSKKLEENTKAIDNLRRATEAADKRKNGSPAGDAVGKLQGSFDDFGRFLPQNQIAEINKRAQVNDGGQLNRSERDRINQLESRFGGVGLRATNETQGRRVARRLFRDQETGENLVTDFRATASAKSAETASRIRGEGARGRRNIDVDAAKEFFEGRGLTGTANNIDSKESAAKALDQFVSLSKNLAEEQGKISRDTREKIIEVLGRELSQGTRDAIAEREGLLTQAEKDKVRREAAQDKIREDNLKKFTNEILGFAEKDRVTLVEDMSVGLKKAIESTPLKIVQGAPLKIELGKQEVVVTGKITGPTNPRSQAEEDEALIKIIRAAMGGINDQQLIARLSKSLGDLVRELRRRGIINGTLGGIDYGSGGPDTPKPGQPFSG